MWDGRRVLRLLRNYLAKSSKEERSKKELLMLGGLFSFVVSFLADFAD